jgi:hypothetical protein
MCRPTQERPFLPTSSGRASLSFLQHFLLGLIVYLRLVGESGSQRTPPTASGNNINIDVPRNLLILEIYLSQPMRNPNAHEDAKHLSMHLRYWNCLKI